MQATEAFLQACLLLRQEPCCLELWAAQKANDQDAELMTLTQQYDAIRAKLNQALESDSRTEEEIVELDAQATKLYGEIMAYPGIIRYHKAKVKAQELMSQLGEMITTAMSGGDPCLNSAKASGGCGGCQGCGTKH